MRLDHKEPWEDKRSRTEDEETLQSPEHRKRVCDFFFSGYIGCLLKNSV